MSRINQKGFTILELLIATMVFSVVFLGATTAILQIGKLYYKGVVSNRTQETVRSGIDSISQQLQFNFEPLKTPAPIDYPVTGPSATTLKFSAYCIGTTRYTYVLNAQVANGATDHSYDSANYRLAHALWRDNVATNGCVPADLGLVNPSNTAGALGSDGQEMLAASMRLSDFKLGCDTATSLCTVSLRVIYGDNDLLEPNPTTAIPTHCASIIGSQWCATSELSTSVYKRVGAI